METNSGDLQPIDGQSSPALQGSPWRELLAILFVVGLADLTIYRGQGYTGIAAFLVGTAAAFFLARVPRVSFGLPVILVGTMLLAISLRLVWFGSPLRLLVGFAWLFAFATTLQGEKPFVFTVIAMTAQTAVAGLQAFWTYTGWLRRSVRHCGQLRLMSIALPLLAVAVFGTLFVLANPDVVKFVGRQIDSLRALSEWFIRTILNPVELVFWGVVAWIAAGFLRPVMRFTSTKDAEVVASAVEAPLYAPFRNTLLTVIVLFAAYLCFEFYSLWTRSFPEGFYYAGYAHAGAAWLTVALALATLTLSLIFSGTMLRDPRLSQLKTLAWIWSAENFLLSLSVYNRLFIYIDFNGMTYMRIVGLFGTSLVVVGFLVVIWKIAFAKNFKWLVQRQLWALAITILLFALTPVDRIAASSNVRRIQQGNLSAVMQIGVQPMDLEGNLALIPLLDSQVPEIREGVAAMIAAQVQQIQREQSDLTAQHWTAYQVLNQLAIKRFMAVQDQWREFQDPDRQEAARSRFYAFAYRYF